MDDKTAVEILKAIRRELDREGESSAEAMQYAVNVLTAAKAAHSAWDNHGLKGQAFYTAMRQLGIALNGLEEGIGSE